MPLKPYPSNLPYLAWRLLRRIPVKRLREAILYTPSPRPIRSVDYASHFAATWFPVQCADNTTARHATQFGDTHVAFDNMVPDSLPEAGVLALRNARIYGKHGWLYSNEGFLLADHSWFRNQLDGVPASMKFPRRQPPAKRYCGKCLTLGSEFSVGGYGHFITDSLARLHLFYNAGFTLDDVDHIFVAKPPKGNAERIFHELKLPVEKCLWADDNNVTEFEYLFAPTYPGTRRNYPPWVVEFYRNQIQLPNQGSRRLYVTRKGWSRNPVNEQQLEQILHRYGFETYDPMEHSSSHLDFAEAQAVVGVSGSALTGLVFCAAGTKVLEIMSSDHLFPYYYTLANAGSLDFSYIVGQSETQRESDAWGPSKHDFAIDTKAFESAVRNLC